MSAHIRLVGATGVCVLLSLFASAASASAPEVPPVRSILVSGTVDALAAATSSDGYVLHVAFVRREHGCDTVWVWKIAEQRIRTLSPRWCDRRVYGLALSEVGVSWATDRDLADGRRVQDVWRVPLSPVRAYGRAGLLASANAEPGEPLPIVVGNDSFVWSRRVYAAGRLVPEATIPALELTPRWVSYEEGVVVVGYRDGRVETYLTQRTPNDPIPYASSRLEPASEVRVVRTLRWRGIALMVGRRLLLRNETLSDYGVETQLPRAASYGDDRCFKPRCAPAELQFADSDWAAVYEIGHQIRVREILTGRDAVVRVPSSGPIHAQIRPTGLVFSAGSRITYLPRAKIVELLG